MKTPATFVLGMVLGININVDSYPDQGPRVTIFLDKDTKGPLVDLAVKRSREIIRTAQERQEELRKEPDHSLLVAIVIFVASVVIPVKVWFLFP